MKPDPIETLRRMRRTAEMSANIMRDTARTEDWNGAERVARQFERLAAQAEEVSACLALPQSEEPALKMLVDNDWLRRKIETDPDDDGGALAGGVPASADRVREALEAMLNHSCVADSASEDKLPEDHAAERKARAAIAALSAAPEQGRVDREIICRMAWRYDAGLCCGQPDQCVHLAPRATTDHDGGAK